jgi:uncharacterized protein YjiS (DUF1127 family)
MLASAKEADMSLFNPNEPLIDIKGWYRAATERRELLAMDDRELRDVGLTRVDVQRLIREPVTVSRPEQSGPTPPRPVPPEVVDAYVARAHRLRSEAIRAAFVAVFRWLMPRRQLIARARKLAPVARYTT